MRDRARANGVELDPGFVLWLQLGPIPWNTYPFLRTACKAFSLLKGAAAVPEPKHELLYQLPAWHSMLFLDTHKNTLSIPEYRAPEARSAGVAGLE